MAVGTVSSISDDTWQLIQTNTTTSGTTSTFSSLSGYKAFMFSFNSVVITGSTDMNFNGDSTTGNYTSNRVYSTNVGRSDTSITLNGSGTTLYGSLTITNVLSPAPKLTTGIVGGSQGGVITGSYNVTNAITSITITTGSGFTSGSISLYGIAA